MSNTQQQAPGEESPDADRSVLFTLCSLTMQLVILLPFFLCICWPAVFGACHLLSHLFPGMEPVREWTYQAMRAYWFPGFLAFHGLGLAVWALATAFRREAAEDMEIGRLQLLLLAVTTATISCLGVRYFIYDIDFDWKHHEFVSNLLRFLTRLAPILLIAGYVLSFTWRHAANSTVAKISYFGGVSMLASSMITGAILEFTTPW